MVEAGRKCNAADRKASKTIRGSNVNQFGSFPVPTPVVDDTIIPPLEAWFIEVCYANGAMCLVNSRCSILHLLTYLKEKYLAEDECLDGVVIVNPDEDPTAFLHYTASPPTSPILVPHAVEPFGSNSSKSPAKNKICRSKSPIPKYEQNTWCLDLVSSDTGVPLDLCYKQRSDFLRLYVKGRQQYYLCKVKKTMNGITRDVVPLVYEPPVELLEHIYQHVQLLERQNKKRDTTVNKKRDKGAPSGRSSRTSIKLAGSTDTVTGVKKNGKRK